jgi:hypothetical protein
LPFYGFGPHAQTNINIGDRVKSYGDDNTIAIGQSATPYGSDKNINLNNGFKSVGSGNRIAIGLQDLAQYENNRFGTKVVSIGEQVSNSGDGNKFNIGASADSTDNQYGHKSVMLNRGLDSRGNGNTFNVGL